VSAYVSNYKASRILETAGYRRAADFFIPATGIRNHK
jgi:hypothetical protein